MISAKEFIVQWRCQLLEKALRLSQVLRVITANAPQYEAGEAPALKSLRSASHYQIADLREKLRAAITRMPETLSANETRMAAQSCRSDVTRFVKLHSKLVHFPRDWVRPEIDLFVNELSAKFSKSVRDKLGYNSSLLENLTITSSANFNFGNLAGSPEYPAGVFEHDEAFFEQFSDDADIIKLPETEQQDICAWPAIVHELGHTIFREFDLYQDAEFLSISQKYSGERISELERRGVRLSDEQRKALLIFYGEWSQEIFCDLFAVSVLGPMFLISLSQHALFWTIHSVQQPSEHYPPIAARLAELGKFLMRTNSKVSAEAVGCVSDLSGARSIIDRTFVEDDARIIERDSIGEMPAKDHVPKLFAEISECKIFTEICGERPKIDPLKVASLYSRVGKGQNIAASRAGEVTKGGIGSIDEKYASLKEEPSDFIEMMTAAVFFQGGVQLSRSPQTPDMFSGTDRHDSYLNRLAYDFSLSDLSESNFLTSAAGFIHNSDHLVIRSLEANMIMRQLIEREGV